MGAASSITSAINGSELLSFSKADAEQIITQYAPVFREDIFDRHADSEGFVSKEVLLRIVDNEVNYAKNMCGE